MRFKKIGTCIREAVMMILRSSVVGVCDGERQREGGCRGDRREPGRVKIVGKKMFMDEGESVSQK